MTCIHQIQDSFPFISSKSSPLLHVTCAVWTHSRKSARPNTVDILGFAIRWHTIGETSWVYPWQNFENIISSVTEVQHIIDLDTEGTAVHSGNMYGIWTIPLGFSTIKRDGAVMAGFEECYNALKNFGGLLRNKLFSKSGWRWRHVGRIEHTKFFEVVQVDNTWGDTSTSDE